MARKNKRHNYDPILANYGAGCAMVNDHPLFAPIWYRVWEDREIGNLCPEDGWAVVTESGYIHVNPNRLAEPEEWAYVLAHCLLHLGMGHFKAEPDFFKWNAACDYFVTRFLADLKFGKAPQEMHTEYDISVSTEKDLYSRFCETGIPSNLLDFSTAGTGRIDMIQASTKNKFERNIKWPDLLGRGLSRAVASAVNVAGGHEAYLGAGYSDSEAQRAKEWFIASYPLLGALAASFNIIEDAQICARNSISIAAIDAETREIFMNSAACLNEDETRFVMAHELMHVALDHQARRQGRDPYLWNVACDYVINGWLLEMGIGDLPEVGVLYDPELEGLSAETLYDRIATDMRRYRKLTTLRGIGQGDILEGGHRDSWSSGEGIELDEFYRRCLMQGLIYHTDQNRGYLPSGMVEEIKALCQPPVPWDVELARWFDNHFTPLELMRTYAWPSRRQACTLDIPRPSWIVPEDIIQSRTYGVVLDTSGSMDRALLAKALGAIASYSVSRQVRAVRVVFCDAAPYDAGYIPAEDISDRVKIRGRGGTMLQPAIDLLDKAEDFPKEGPILIITDGYCERLKVQKNHAFLIPKGNQLPFLPRGQVFRIE
ncbi:MAG: DUF2201 family putative metallopeptidase [Candidatus Saccharibacteria bacterium]